MTDTPKPPRKSGAQKRRENWQRIVELTKARRVARKSDAPPEPPQARVMRGRQGVRS